MFYKLVVLKNFAKFPWKHLRPGTVKDSSTGVSWEFCKIFKNFFFAEYLWTTTSGLFHSFYCFLPPSELWIFSYILVFFATQWLTETRFFLFLNMFYHRFWTWWIWRILLLENYILRFIKIHLLKLIGKRLYSSPFFNGVTYTLEVYNFIEKRHKFSIIF